MAATVDPLLPLSLLEAVRAVDTPSGEYEAEFVHELRNKRLGLSDTVFAQIKRYTDAVRRKQRPPFDEAVALATLVGRRPDAEEVFREGGRILARQAYRRISPVTRRLMLSLPSLLSRPIALRHARRITARYAEGAIRRVGSTILLEVPPLRHARRGAEAWRLHILRVRAARAACSCSSAASAQWSTFAAPAAARACANGVPSGGRSGRDRSNFPRAARPGPLPG